MTIDLPYLETQADALFQSLSARAEHENHRQEIAQFRANFEQRKASINCPAIEYCINEFVKCELDYTTPGMRGLGRLTTDIPRLGAYFRNQISNLPSSQLEVLSNLIVDLITQPYIFWVVLRTDSADVNNYQPRALYEKWVPRIYEWGIEQLGEGRASALAVISEPLFNKLLTYFNERRMKPGFLHSDKRSNILTGYVQAGVSLGGCEHKAVSE